MVRTYVCWVALFLAGCASARPSPGTCEGGKAWTQVCATLDATSWLRDGVVLVGDRDGVLLTWRRGQATARTPMRIASATKWVAAAVFLSAIERGEMTLETRASEHLPWWTRDPEDPRSRVTLGDLLSFTSGLEGTPLQVRCVNQARSDVQRCAREIYDRWFVHEPGATFFYSPGHMHVAAAMLERATGKRFQELFARDVVARLGLDPGTRYVMAGPGHPRIAGGLSMRAGDYAVFLRRVLDGSYLPKSQALWWVDHVAARGARIGYSPLTQANLTWHYSLGAWKECPKANYDAECAKSQVYSSPGAYGFYPWIDRDRGYWAVLATERSIWANPSKASVLAGLELAPAIARALGTEAP